MEKLNNNGIRKKLSETTVDFDLNAEWDNITEILDKKKKDRKVIFWILSVLAISLISIYIGISSKDIPKDQRTKEMQTQLEIVNKTESVLASNQNDLFDQNLNENKKQILNINSRENINYDTNKNYKTTSKEIQDINQKNIQISLPSEDYFKKTQKIDIFNPSQKVTNSSIQKLKSNPIKKETVINVNSSIEKPNPLNTIQISLPINPYIIQANPKTVPLSIKTFVVPTLTLFAHAAFTTPKTALLSNDNIGYVNQLQSDYTILNQSSISIGIIKKLSPQFDLLLGVNYEQYRSVYKGEFEITNEEFIQRDTAIVFTNFAGGNVYQSGDLTQITTTRTKAQQFSYQHRLGLQIGLQYNFTKHIFGGAHVNWTPISWHNGQIITANYTIENLHSHVNKDQQFDLNFELGWRQNISNRIGLDLGINYSPKQLLTSIDNVDIRSESIGVLARIKYNLNK